MPTLITGGTGFIGAHVAKGLMARGETVVAYDLMPDPALLKAVLGPELARVTVVRGDILDLPLMVRTARDHKVDKVVHLAYVLGTLTERNPALGTRVNVEGTNNVFEMAGFVEARRVVWASSVAVYGPRSAGSDGVVGADAPYDPQTIYGACKLTNELASSRYSYIYGLDPIGLRFPVVYGPEVRRGWAGFLCDMAAALVRGERYPAVPHNDQMVSWGYVEDIAEAVMLALDCTAVPRRVYTLGGFEATVAEMVDFGLKRFPGAEASPLERFATVRLETRCDLSPAESDLGWQPRVRAEEGMDLIVEHYRRLSRQES